LYRNCACFPMPIINILAAKASCIQNRINI
jgi:hypothetical protein